MIDLSLGKYFWFCLSALTAYMLTMVALIPLGDTSLAGLYDEMVLYFHVFLFFVLFIFFLFWSFTSVREKVYKELIEEPLKKDYLLIYLIQLVAVVISFYLPINFVIICLIMSLILIFLVWRKLKQFGKYHYKAMYLESCYVSFHFIVSTILFTVFYYHFQNINSVFTAQNIGEAFVSGFVNVGLRVIIFFPIAFFVTLMIPFLFRTRFFKIMDTYDHLIE